MATLRVRGAPPRAHRAPRAEFLPFARPSIGDAEIAAVTETLRSGWLTTGPRVQAFEAAFAAYIGAPHAVATNSATAALHLALAAVGVQPGDEVIVPTNTFAACGEVVTYFGARPVLVDVRRDTYNLDERLLETAITPRTRAIMPVHFAGQPVEIDAVAEIARAHGVAVVEDAAHALPARYRGRMIGTTADVSAFSFYANKTITTGEGGMATTADEAYAARIRSLSLHGISRDGWTRYTAAGSWRYDILEAGFKYNLTDIAASIGIVQLQQAEQFRARRQAIADAYTAAFTDCDALQPPVVAPHVQHAWHLYVPLLRPEALRIDRDRFLAELRERNIGTSVHFIPLHLHSYYREVFGYRPGDLSNAEWIFERAFSLPIYPAMTDGDVADVIAAVTDVLSAFRR